MAAHGELLELSKHLKHERLFICSEREQLQALNEDVSKTAEKLYHLSWITRHQKINLDGLILANKNATPEVCCQRANAMDNVVFVDGYKYLTYHENKIGELMKWLRESPKIVARCLVMAEKTSLETMHHMTQITMSGLYGNAVMQEDENLVLQVLKALIDMQVASSESPRKLLRKGSCAFSVVFKLLNEGLFNAKLFLTAALHKPVMQLLMEDEWFYDIDPDRALHRFPSGERQKRFSQPGTAEFQNKTKQYRQIITNKLAMLAERFISSVKNNMYCFPQSLAWIVSQLYHSVTKAGHVNATEARAMCADLVLTFFICPAICDPEAYGITSDAPISYIARHNLMQVAQILQVLAISKWEEVDPKIRDVYGKFEKGCMSFLLDAVLDTPTSDVPIQTGSPLQGLSRVAGLLTLTDLTELLNFLRTTLGKLDDNSSERKELETFLENVPSPAVIQSIQAKSTPNTTPQPTPPGTPSTAKKLSRGKERKRLNLTPDDPEDDNIGSRSDLENVLVISLGVSNECPGMLSEQKVLEQEVKQRKVKSNSLIPGEDDPISESEIHLHEKRTRFSLSHDQDSIATSDNLEAISEAASSHSVGSDLENENDNDNLSDMVSANVSGRGTPNISGRDTPISQADSQAESVEEIRAPDLPVLVQKTNREDVTDRFGKFEIKQELERDEVKSTVSDTWSTDVLASDSEPPESNQLERLEEVAEEVARQNLLGIQIHEVSEVSETASDAWSTDVLASDTSEKQVDRLLELDQDEIGSVSSRGQGPDSELGEAQDQAEDTPQASGTQSPKAAESGEDLVDVGGIGEDDIQDVLEAPGFRPLTADSVRIKPDRYSDPTHDRSGDYNDLLKEEYKQRAVSDMVGLYQGIEGGKGDYVANTRISSSFQYTVGKVTSVLEVFDPLVTSSTVSSSKPVSEDSPEYLSIQVEEKSLCSSSQTLVSEGALSPDRSDQNEATLTKASEISETRKLSDSENVTSEVSVSVKSSNQNEPILRPTINKPQSDETDSLKLTEQQNFKIDANRLSNTPASLFDPLMPENGTESAGVSRQRSASEGFTPIAPKPYTSGRSGSYSSQGARPKVTPPEQHVTPRIAFKVNSVEIDLNGSLPGDNEADKVPAQTRTSQQIGRESTASKDSKNPTGDVSSGEKHNNSEDVKIKRSNLNSEEMKMRRSSTDSSESSTEMQSATSGSRIASAEISVKPDESRESADMKDEVDGKKKAGTSFFRSFKERLVKGPFPVTVSVRGGKSKVTKHGEKEKILRNGGSGDPGINYKTMSFDASDEHLIRTRTGLMQRAQSEDPSGLQQETTDDILAKYRKQPSPMKPGSSTNMPTDSANHVKEKEMAREEEQESPPTYDPNNLETCKAFWDAKKKLRLVLSNADFQAMTCSTCYHGSVFLRSNNNERKENELVAYLKAQLAEAINLQDKHVVAQLHETIRCLRQFDSQEIKKLLRIMKEEYRSRSPYIAYLVRCRQGLLATHSHLERLLTRVQRDKMICNKYFLSVFVRLFLEKREKQLMKFIADFQKLTVADEKTDLVERFLSYLHSQMDKDPIWQVASEAQLDDAKLYIERSVMSHVYTHAMFPNGDGDIMRDQILHEHVKKLAKVITTRHSDLRIPKVYHYEAPWPAAQEEIFMINAYKTPKDKLQCVLRCSSTIMNLLSLANEKSVPAADDFMPVLIYVLIKANPPCLLSTVQYVTSFYEKRLQGEEQYWWMQFAAAIEFIKTMDYGD